MRRIATLAIVGVVVLLVAAQIALPRLAASRVGDRLTRGGGSADVHVSAFPAVRLLFTEGDSVRVRARGIELPLVAPRGKALDQLDGFDDVDVRVTDATAGPFRLSAVSLERRGGDSPYHASVTGTVTGRDLATFAGGVVGGPLGGFFGGLTGGATPFGNAPVPLNLDAVLASDGGRVHAVSVQGTVAGIPAGPLVEALALALAGRF